MDTKLYRLNNNRKIIPVNIKTHIFASRYGYSRRYEWIDVGFQDESWQYNSFWQGCRKFIVDSRKDSEQSFPEVILERIAATGGVCKVSVGEGVVIEMDKEIAEETVYIISSLGEQNIELDIEEVEKERLTCIMGADLFPVISVHDSFASVLVGRMMYFNDMAAEQYNLRKWYDIQLTPLITKIHYSIY